MRQLEFIAVAHPFLSQYLVERTGVGFGHFLLIELSCIWGSDKWPEGLMGFVLFQFCISEKYIV